MTTRTKPHRNPHEVNCLMDLFGTADVRKVKRIERKVFGFTAVYDAYQLGEAHARRQIYRNPYPPGRRHNEYKRGVNYVEDYPHYC